MLGHEHREVDYTEGEDVHVYEAYKEALDAAICKMLRVHPQNERAYHYCMNGLVHKEDDLSCLILLHNQSHIVDQCHQIPQVVAAQWALESGYGKHISGTHNYFGLKGSGTDHETKEFIDGKWITITAGFLNFPDLQSCVSYLVQRWYKDYKAYKGVNRASTPDECAQLLVKEGYATDPLYATKLQRLLKEHG